MDFLFLIISLCPERFITSQRYKSLLRIAEANTSSSSVFAHSVGALFVVIINEAFSWSVLIRLKNHASESFFTSDLVIMLHILLFHVVKALLISLLLAVHPLAC